MISVRTVVYTVMSRSTQTLVNACQPPDLNNPATRQIDQADQVDLVYSHASRTRAQIIIWRE